MSINQSLEKIKPFYGLLLLLSIAVIFFSLGRLSVVNNEKTPINIGYPNQNLTATAINSSTSSPKTVFGQGGEVLTSTPDIKTDGPVIGSKSGKKYYFPWCGTVKRIKPENQVKFGSIAEAKSAGFTPGGNCKGLN